MKSQFESLQLCSIKSIFGLLGISKIAFLFEEWFSIETSAREKTWQRDFATRWLKTGARFANHSQL